MNLHTERRLASYAQGKESQDNSASPITKMVVFRSFFDPGPCWGTKDTLTGLDLREARFMAAAFISSIGVDKVSSLLLVLPLLD